MNPRSADENQSDTISGGSTEHEPESRSWTRQVPTPPGRSLHAPPTISVYVPSGPILLGAGRSRAGCQHHHTQRIWDQRTRTRQTERLVLVKEQNRSFLGPGEIDKTSSGVTLGSVGTVDSCLAANTGKYICPSVGPGPELRRQRSDRLIDAFALSTTGFIRTPSRQERYNLSSLCRVHPCGTWKTRRPVTPIAGALSDLPSIKMRSQTHAVPKIPSNTSPFTPTIERLQTVHNEHEK
jgi:hypothetical protein